MSSRAAPICFIWLVLFGCTPAPRPVTGPPKTTDAAPPPAQDAGTDSELCERLCAGPWASCPALYGETPCEEGCGSALELFPKQRGCFARALACDDIHACFR